MRCTLAHGIAVFLRGVASAHRSADLQCRQAHGRQLRGNPGQRRLQVDLNIIGQRLERRNVNHQGLRGQFAAVLQPRSHQLVEHGEERGQGFARAGRRGDQGRLAGLDQRPGLGLGGRHGGKAVLEPGTYGRVKAGQCRVCLGELVHGLVMRPSPALCKSLRRQAGH